MNIKGINFINSINYYNKVTCNKNDKIEKYKNCDRIEISEVSKALNEYGIDNNNFDNKKRVMEVKKEILKGTYTYDSKGIAKCILEEMKGKKKDE